MYPKNESRSDRLYERACKVLPGGNSRHTVFFPPHPLYAARGQGARIWDADGVERLDLINNYSALIHGHNHLLNCDGPILRPAGLMPAERGIRVPGGVCSNDVRMGIYNHGCWITSP